MIGTTVDRATLYAKVWAAPMAKVGEEYGVSGSTVKNACDFLNVPAPPTGYWAQKKFGREPVTPPLPSDVRHETFTFQGDPAAGPYHRPEDDAWLEERTRLESEPSHAIEFDPAPRRWHPTMQPLWEFLKAESVKVEASRRACERFDRMTPAQKSTHWNMDRSPWLWIANKGELMPGTHRPYPFRVSLGTWRRALAIMNAICHAAPERGYATEYSKETGRVVIRGHGAEAYLRISENTEAKVRLIEGYEGKKEREKYKVPLGLLKLYLEISYVGSGKTLGDSAKEPLETRLHDVFHFMNGPAVLARRKGRYEAVRQREAEATAIIWRESQRRQYVAAKLEEAEAKRRKLLIEEAADLRQAEEIRRYISHVRTAGAAVDQGDYSQGHRDWIEWAIGIADGMDPTSQRLTKGLDATPNITATDEEVANHFAPARRW